MDDFTNEDYWKGIILYGLNAATYKMALARCLLDFAQQGKTHVDWGDLSTKYLDLYIDRLNDSNRPQQGNSTRLTKMERYVRAINTGNISQAQALDLVAAEAFTDVIPRFQTIGLDKSIAAGRFYEINYGNQIILTDDMLRLGENDATCLYEEIDARWALLEGAFQISQSQEQLQLANNIRDIYLINATQRTTLTPNIPFLQGYQGNICFYCGNELNHEIHVDHVLPWQVIQHDHIWNLVLSHAQCNMDKSDKLVGDIFITKLEQRNENIMGSNHPWKAKIVAELGNTPTRRKQKLRMHYDNVKSVLGRNYWGGSDSYNPSTDYFYRKLITKINNR
jgi:hypothetical protein